MSASTPTFSVCRLPGSVSRGMVFDLLRALPRPPIGDPAPEGRIMIRDALELLWNYQPRDIHEAMTAMHIVILTHRSLPSAIITPPHQDDPVETLRYRRHAAAMQRQTEALKRQYHARRRDLERRGALPDAKPSWTYVLAALEAVWRKRPVLVRSDDEAKRPMSAPPSPEKQAIAPVVA